MVDPMSTNNVLSKEQYDQAMIAIGKLKVHDLSAIISQLNLRRPRSTKSEQQKALHAALQDPGHARNIYTLAVSMSQGNYEMSRRGNHSSARSAPYTLPGQRNGANGLMNHNMQQQPMIPHMMHPFQQHQQPHQPHQPHQLVQQHHHQQQQHHNSNSHPQRAAPFEIVSLPFYDVVETLLHPYELAGVNSNNKTTKQLSFNFVVSQDKVQSLNYRIDAPLPRYEVQLRFFNLTEPNGPQKDDFPLNAYVRIDDGPVQLPNVIPTNKPNVEPKRPSRPVNITSHVNRYMMSQQGSHRLNVEWLADRRKWACVVYYVHRVDAKILFNRVNENLHKHKLIEDTKNEVIQKLTGGGEDEIAMDKLTISLLDPLIKTRMVTPARCIDCTHLQCFDLKSYLMMNEKKPTWTCPVCSGHCPYDRLIVDDYFRDMLEKVDKNTTEVELKQDGSYDVLTIDDIECLSDDDEDIKPLRPSNGAAASSATNAAVPSENGGKKKKPVVDDDIIVLSDDDDDDPLLKQAPADSTSPQTPPRSNPSANVVKKTQSCNDIEIITLDDTPPRPVLPVTLMRQMSQSTSSAPPSAVPGGMSTLTDALSQIGNNGVPRSSAQPCSSASAPQQHPSNPMMTSHQHQYMQAISAATSNFGYPPMMQPPQYQMQNGLIGRQNQMAPQQMGQQNNVQSPMLSPQYYQQAMNGNSTNSLMNSIPPPRLPPSAMAERRNAFDVMPPGVTQRRRV